jgi:hypothetical protein
MDGFKSLPKMQCFKEGGKVKPKAMCYGGKMKKGGEVDKADIEQDKKMIKKAFKQHDEAEHDKEPTEIKLRKGGRAKKEAGTVKKYKKGGEVTNVYEAKKGSGDLDNIEKVKKIKPTEAKAPSKASTKPAMKGSDVAKEKNKPAGRKDPYIKSKESGKAAAASSGAKGGPNKYKKGGDVKKFADGMSTGVPSEEAHTLALMEEMRKLPPYMQLQLLQQQQNMGGKGAMSNLANQMQNPMANQQGMMPNLPSGINPNQD